MPTALNDSRSTVLGTSLSVEKRHHLAREHTLDRPRKARLGRHGPLQRGKTGRRPDDGVDHHVVRSDPEERAAVEAELRADAREERLDSVGDLFVWKIDELKGELGDKSFELELLFKGGPLGVAHAVPLGDVYDRRQHEQPFRRLQRLQRNLDREGRAVLTTARQLAARGHRAGRGGRGETLPVGLVDRLQRLGQQHLDGLADDLVARVAKLPLDLAVDEDDRTASVDYEDATWRGLNRQLKRRRLVTASPDHGHVLRATSLS